ncbi:hypothetical protein AB0H83_50755 [Dactylosporangium sp. NPDC050688]|uniref:hypothetical protein n=1 Tax=Dactylosporangium sp. NPDC050688 TaxID=3157217 RepID=UPI0033E95354
MHTELLTTLLDQLSAEDRDNVRRCTRRLSASLPKPAPGDNVVLVAYGGGKDSSYTVAFVRAMQLTLLAETGATFTLRVATNRQAGMPDAVMRNIDRVYTALGLYGDDRCELLLVDADEVRPFDADLPHSPTVLARNRTDVLLTGHRTAADARPTFCNACNLSMVNAFGLAAAYRGGVEVIVTGDSRQEQRAYVLWVHRLARRFGSRGATGTPGFKGFLHALDDLSQTYFTDIHGPGPAVSARRITSAVPAELCFFSIYDETEYSSGDHWRLLTDFLGFEFDELAFSFTESDCANPALMAHLRALKCERFYGRDYVEGLAEYVDFAIDLMHRKEFPQVLVDTMAERYRAPGAAERLRARINTFAWDSYRLTEQQLICMVYAPFAGQGRELDRFVSREHPTALGRLDDLHAALAGAPPSRQDAEFLTGVSGLDLEQLRTVYRSPVPGRPNGAADGSMLEAILAGDPHKAVISTRHASAGPAVAELISGR